MAAPGHWYHDYQSKGPVRKTVGNAAGLEAVTWRTGRDKKDISAAFSFPHRQQTTSEVVTSLPENEGLNAMWAGMQGCPDLAGSLCKVRVTLNSHHCLIHSTSGFDGNPKGLSKVMSLSHGVGHPQPICLSALTT